MQFSFSLVNLLDPNSKIETPVLGQMLGWLGVLVVIGSGLDRSLLAAVVRSFRAVPVGQAVMQAKTGVALAAMAGGIFLAGLQLAAPVIAAALAVEVTIALVAQAFAATAGDGGEHSAEDDGVVCGADWRVWRCGRDGLSGTLQRCWMRREGHGGAVSEKGTEQATPQRKKKAQGERR